MQKKLVAVKAKESLWLTQLEQYTSMDQKASDWDVQLRGACP